MKDVEEVFFSVVIACYNAEKTIGLAVNSCLNQSFKHFEIIVVDDASSDNSPGVMSELINANPNVNIELIKVGVNSGPSYCRNLGWKKAEGKYIAFLDADDIWHRNKLEVCHSWISALNCDLLAHSYNDESMIIFNPLSVENFIAKEKSYFDLLMKNISQTSCIVIRNGLVAGGGFDTTMRYTEDHDLWLRVSYSKRAYFISGKALTALGRPQLSRGGLSGNRWGMRKGEMKMYLKSTKYSNFSLFLFPLLIIYSLTKYLKKEISLRVCHG